MHTKTVHVDIRNSNAWKGKVITCHICILSAKLGIQIQRIVCKCYITAFGVIIIKYTDLCKTVVSCQEKKLHICTVKLF